MKNRGSLYHELRRSLGTTVLPFPLDIRGYVGTWRATNTSNTSNTDNSSSRIGREYRPPVNTSYLRFYDYFIIIKLKFSLFVLSLSIFSL